MENLDDIYSSINNDSVTVTGSRCIGPCFPANIIAKHPDTGNTITSNDNFCPVEPHTITTKNGVKQIETEKCTHVTYNSAKYRNIIDGEIDYRKFLSLIYNVNSFYDTINYIKKNIPNIYTENRLISMSWQVFSVDKDNIPNVVYTYYADKFLKQWEPEFRKSLEKHGLIDDVKKYNDNVALYHGSVKTIKLVIDAIVTRQKAYISEEGATEVFSKQNIDFYIKIGVYNTFKTLQEVSVSS